MIFGDKTISWFDLWSIQHFVVGIVFGIILRKNNFSKIAILFVALFLAYSWEIFEYYAEVGYFGSSIMTWFGGVEFLWNRVLIDPIVFTGGVMIGQFIKNNGLVYLSFAYSACWLLLNLMFPTAASFQRLLF